MASPDQVFGFPGFANQFGQNKNDSDMRCDRYYTEKNTTYFIYGGYEGIPENLLINVIICLVSHTARLMYTVLRIYMSE